MLELGSGSEGGIVPYLKQATVGVEPTASRRSAGTALAGSGLALPFPNRAFDWSVCVDVLEHVEPAQRAAAIGELLRVSQHGSVIVVPCDEAAAEQDRLLDETYLRLHGHRFPFLAEHVALGLPRAAEIYQSICEATQAAGRHAAITYRPINSLNVRWLLMRLWMSPSPLGQYLYSRTLVGLLPALCWLNAEPTYRFLFEVRLDRWRDPTPDLAR